MRCDSKGARYNFTGVLGIGIPSSGDSLAAVKKLVYDEKIITMDELLEVLDYNFEDNLRLRELRINRAPKYGNDDDYVDEITRTVSEIYCTALIIHKNIRGGIFHAGAYSVSAHVVFRALVGALPSGRLARTPLNNGLTPCHGCDKLGPTASIKSVVKMNHKDITNGPAYTPLILENAKKITESFKNIVFRFAIIPGINDKKENIAKISHFIKERNRNEVHLIPYHKLGHDKYRILGVTPPYAHIKLIDQEMINTVKRRFMKEGVTPILIE